MKVYYEAKLLLFASLKKQSLELVQKIDEGEKDAMFKFNVNYKLKMQNNANRKIDMFLVKAAQNVLEFNKGNF